MAKKDFSKINTSRVFENIAEALEEEAPAETEKKKYKDRKTYTEEEAAAALLEGKTTGKKGLKLPRINLAFSLDVYNYVKTMSRVRGETLTDFINHILRQSMEENAEIYEKAKDFQNSL